MKRALAVLAVLVGMSFPFVGRASATPARKPPPEATAQSQTCDTDYQTCILETQLVPNDPYLPLQYGPQIAHAPEAWDVWMGSPSTVIAIVDTGIDCTHPDLIRCVPGFDFVHGVPLAGTENSDDNSHGTHVTGIAAATTNNGVGMAGMAQVSYMPLKACTTYGECPESIVAAANRYAADHGAKVINMSLGGVASAEEQAAVDYAYQHDVLVISACGNYSGFDCLYPAAFANSMGVSCTDSADRLCSFSSTGTQVDVAAPGQGILSTVPGADYAYLSGTSMSTPHTVGVAGLIRSQHPEYTADQTWGLLELSADDLGPAGYDVSYGFGRVNAFRAVTTPAPPGRLSPSAPPPCAPPRHLTPHGKCVGPTSG